MKKSILIILATVAIVAIVIFVAISMNANKGEKGNAGTPATVLVQAFEDIIANETDLSVIAQTLSENEVLDTKIMVEKRTNEDFLNGFDNQITNFNEAYVIQPMIGSIPFVAYVFETSDAAALEKELNDNANPRWNICVEADETKVKVVNNYVFFVMSPNEF